jgi:acyl-CoA dehydrogenase
MEDRPLESDLELDYGTLLQRRPATRAHILAARAFRLKHIDPVALEIDRRMLADPHYHPADIVQKGCEYGLLSLPIPRFAGGGGGTILDVSVVLEELCSGCAGIANIFGAHYLGLTGALIALDLNIYDRVFREVTAAERDGRPVLLAAAVTEPMAGTDVEEAEFLPHARLVTCARAVDGGYRIDGSKVFISNGSVASYVMTICPLDRKRPLETWSGFLVPADSPGFSASRVELKMGQRACHAAELRFDNCFVAAENLIGVEGRGMAMTELVLTASRPPVGAIATGIARGAYERTLAYCRDRRAGAGHLIDCEWVQQALADMRAELQLARGSYLHAAALFDQRVLDKAYGSRILVDPLMVLLGPLRRSALGLKLTASKRFKQRMADLVQRRIGNGWRKPLGLSSLAKFSCSDAAMRVCLKAMEVLGPDAADERHGVEKALRDARLTQIYEGTNQLNRYQVYKQLIEGNHA